MTTAVLAGLLTGLSLIVAIGAQNAFVLRQGIRRAHVGLVVAICAVSDLLLILAGVAGIGVVVDHARWLLDVVRWLGVAFLLWYAVASLRRTLRAESLVAGTTNAEEPAARVAGRALALTWLNPHVYLDTVLLLGSIAAVHDADVAGGRWWFALGACLASLLFFGALGYGARLLAPVLARPRAWVVVDVVVALTMIGVAIQLALGALR